jgi:sulfide:quinone oxidoreductase
VAVAHELRRLLPQPHRVVVVDRDARAGYPPSFGWVMTSARRAAALARERGRLTRRGIEFVNADVHQIDLEARQVRADSRELRYDRLVVALGAELLLEETPGLSEVGQTFYSLEGAERLAANLRYLAGGRVAIVVAGEPIKGPSAVYEGAMLLEHYFHERRMRQKVEIDIYTPEARPLAAFGDEASELIGDLLAHKGIGVHLGRQLESVDGHHHELHFSDGSTAGFESLIAIPRQRAPHVVRDAHLTDEDGWVAVDPVSLETGHANVFAIGDVTRIDLPEGGALPKTGSLARAQARAVARTIASRVLGRGPAGAFDGRGHLIIEVGAGAACAVTTNFYAPGRPTEVRQASLVWHLAKVGLEKYWLSRTY